jgi:hypothetical protein
MTEGSMTGRPYGGTNQPRDDDAPLPGEKPEHGQVGANPAEEPRAAQGPMSDDVTETSRRSEDPDAKAPDMPDATGPTG